MTVILSLISEQGAVVASDSAVLKIEQKKGVLLEPVVDLHFDKTFSVGNWLIGASANAIYIDNKPISHYITSLFLGKKPVSTEESLNLTFPESGKVLIA